MITLSSDINGYCGYRGVNCHMNPQGNLLPGNKAVMRAHTIHDVDNNEVLC